MSDINESKKVKQSSNAGKKEGFEFGPAAICAFMTVLMVVGVIAGLHNQSPLPIILFMLPAVVYEVMRTQGESTKASSLIILAAISAELLLILFKIKFDLAKYLNMSSFYFQGTHLPLGDVTTLIPAAVAVASIVLIKNTRGIYTKWLSIIIIIASVALIYSLAPKDFDKFIQMAFKSLMYRYGGSF